MESQTMTFAELTTIDLVAQGPPTRQSQQLSKSGLELRQECFNAVLREYNPVGFAETMLAREIARCAAQMIRDELLLDATEAQAQRALMLIARPAMDAGAPEIPPISIAQICAPERLDILSRATLRN